MIKTVGDLKRVLKDIDEDYQIAIIELPNQHPTVKYTTLSHITIDYVSRGIIIVIQKGT